MDAEVLRMVNLVLCAVLLFACSMRLTRDWPHWTRRERVVRVHLVAYLFCIAYGTAESLQQGNPFGWRLLLLLAVHISFLLALFRNRRDPVR